MIFSKIVGEIGINHNASLANVFKLIDLAANYNFDYVKFQKREPDVCVPEAQKQVLKQTLWGNIPYIKYRKLMEFDYPHYNEIDKYCKRKNIRWFASVWDMPSADFINQFSPEIIKIPSAKITDIELLKKVKRLNRKIMISTGMSTEKEIDNAVKILGDDIIIMHCNSSYPAKDEELNLSYITVLKKRYPKATIGYSGHEKGVTPSIIASMLGAEYIERHITLDRTMWGSDHPASLEPEGMRRLCRDIKLIPTWLGDGVKKIYDEEQIKLKQLR